VTPALRATAAPMKQGVTGWMQMKHCKNLIVLQEELTKEGRSLELCKEFSRTCLGSYGGLRVLEARTHVEATLVVVVRAKVGFNPSHRVFIISAVVYPWLKLWYG
jgi:hypothetical protein